MKKARADALLVERGLADSVAKARALIMAGRVASAGRQIEKAGEPLAGDVPLSLKAGRPYVGRGGLKLAEALDAFRVSPSGLVCADIGVSTGGFTDCLLQRGALRVYAVDVSVRQIDDRLRRDRRVALIEKNARLLQPGDFPEPVGLVVMDVSFISILKILPALAAVLRSGRETAGGEEPILLSLIKPQFEADRRSVGRGGVIRNPEIHDRVL
ncbi:MAG TPA: TlyA family RNA methyltransferase, partial [Candidatus Aminicenantes bacterium]|nr:TlyA family RNA methyltransferase [Candidatus Aminicenantes bacterium]